MMTREYDNALMRPGRLCRYVELKEFTDDEVTSVLDYHGIHPDEYKELMDSIGRDYGNITLAELLDVIRYIKNPVGKFQLAGEDRSTKVGFG